MENNKLLKEYFLKMQNKIRQIDGIDTALGGICEKYWLTIKGKKFLFKSPVPFTFTDFGEVFTSYLSYLLGFKCVKSIFFKDPFSNNKKNEEEKYGSITESYYKDKTQEEISLFWLKEKYGRRHFGGFTVNEVMEICKDFAEDKNLILDKNLEQDLKEMALMDYLLIQTDRHAKNVAFLINKKNGLKTLEMAPMFDNGYSLFLQQNFAIINIIQEELEATKYVQMTSSGYANTPPAFYIEYTEKVDKERENIPRDLATELINNKQLMKLYEKFMSLNLKDELEFINSLTKRPLPQYYIETIILGVKNRVNLLELELAKQTIKRNFKELEN